MDAEIQAVNALSMAMLERYAAWGDKVDQGEIHHTMYGDMVDFVNFRMETAETCLSLIEQRRIADCLGLCRSLLENCMLLMLKCRGRKYFTLERKSELSEKDLKAYVKEKQEVLARANESTDLGYLEVRRYPLRSGYVMYVREGWKPNPDEDFLLPMHYVEFQDFQPEVMRLRHDHYFDSIPLDKQDKKLLIQHQEEAQYFYRNYLSYDALLLCLQLNGLIDTAVQRRIDAHYTFLGMYLHPTPRAARELREGANQYDGEPCIGMRAPYTKTAILLASLYVCNLIAALLDEITSLFEAAPTKYIKSAGTNSIRQLTNIVPHQLPYFWFLFNEAPLYDRFNYCIFLATAEETQPLTSYRDVSGTKVPFNSHVYQNLNDALMGWTNPKWGRYESPLDR